MEVRAASTRSLVHVVDKKKQVICHDYCKTKEVIKRCITIILTSFPFATVALCCSRTCIKCEIKPQNTK